MGQRAVASSKGKVLLCWVFPLLLATAPAGTRTGPGDGSKVDLGGLARVATEAAGRETGLAVVLGTTDGRLEAALAAAGRRLVHALGLDPKSVDAARRYLEPRGLCGRVTVERASTLKRLPYAEKLVNLLVADIDALGDRAPPQQEIDRVLAPGGAAYLKRDGRWQKTTKPRPDGMDVWTHLNHGPDGNPVSGDRHVANPYGIRWIGSKVMGWGSFSIRATESRVFLFWDTLIQWVDPRPGMLKIEARDAFSGVLLWEEYYPFPEGERTRPVATDERIYMLSGRHVIGIDAASGKVLVTFRECESPFDCVVAHGVLLARDHRAIWGFDAESGKLLWKQQTQEHADVLARYAKRRRGHFEPGWRRQLLVVGDGRVYFADHRPRDGGEQSAARVVGLDVRSGREAWQASGEHVGQLPHPCFHCDGVLALTNENGYAGIPTGSRGQAWTVPVRGWKDRRNYRFGGFSGIGISGYLATDGLIWIKDRQKQRLGDEPYTNEDQKPFKGWIGVDPHSGQIKRRIYYNHKDYWSGRCYADVALPGRLFADNMEIVDLKTGRFSNFRAARGQCGSGHIFANGLSYTSPMRCVSCYPMLRGLVALSGEKEHGMPIKDEERLERGPAYSPIPNPRWSTAEADWPMYRHNPLRTSSTPMEPPHKLDRLWAASFPSRATAPVAADDRLMVAVINQGRVVAMDPQTGKPLWTFVAGGRIDTPPTIHGPLCLFRCHDGAVYCLRVSDGDLVWRYDCAPEHRRIVAYDWVESPWPVMGSVLVYRDVLYAIAGRLTRVDGGMYLVALDPRTGKRIWRRHLEGIFGGEAHVLPRSWYVHEEHMTNNLLVAKGDSLRLYDEFGTWQFALKDGQLEGRSSEIPQPGWPKGRLTPKDPKAAERWPWCGWDRVTSAELLAGEDTYNSMAPGMHPFTRAVPKYQAWLFADDRRWGIHGVRLNKDKRFVIEPARFRQRHLDPEKMPWRPRTLDLDVKAYVFAGDTLLVAGGTPVGPHHRGGQVRAIWMATGKDLAVADLPAPVSFDGMIAACGNVYVSTTDGKVVCLGEKR